MLIHEVPNQHTQKTVSKVSPFQQRVRRDQGRGLTLECPFRLIWACCKMFPMCFYSQSQWWREPVLGSNWSSQLSYWDWDCSGGHHFYWQSMLLKCLVSTWFIEMALELCAVVLTGCTVAVWHDRTIGFLFFSFNFKIFATNCLGTFTPIQSL